MPEETTLTVAAKGRLINLLSTYDPATRARGSRYAAEGNVVGLRRGADGLSATAFVHGTQIYQVTLGPYRYGHLESGCTCPAFPREGRCKHVAAVAMLLQLGSAAVARSSLPVSVPAAVPARAAGPAASTVSAEPLPPCLRGVYSASVFLSRLSVHAAARIGDGVDRWSPLPDWWARTTGASTPAVVALRRHVLAHAEEIAKDLETLRTWTPPELPEDVRATTLGEVYAKLADRYLEVRDGVRIQRGAPGPLEGRRHPGFDFFYDAQRCVFEARERRNLLLLEPFRLAFALPLSSRGDPRFEDQAFGTPEDSDAWEVFALRAVILALHARTEDAVVALERELARPVWEHVLEHLGTPAHEAVESREWSFALSPTYRENELRVIPHSRRSLVSGKPSKWKRETFEALYMDESVPLGREIARIAMCSLERVSEARVMLGTPQGHELLRLLGKHPNVLMRRTVEGRPRGRGARGDHRRRSRADDGAERRRRPQPSLHGRRPHARRFAARSRRDQRAPFRRCEATRSSRCSCRARCVRGSRPRRASGRP